MAEKKEKIAMKDLPVQIAIRNKMGASNFLSSFDNANGHVKSQKFFYYGSITSHFSSLFNQCKNTSLMFYNLHCRLQLQILVSLRVFGMKVTIFAHSGITYGCT